MASLIFWKNSLIFIKQNLNNLDKELNVKSRWGVLLFVCMAFIYFQLGVEDTALSLSLCDSGGAFVL